MKIQYWGTAAAEGVPGIFCGCEVCREAREKGGRFVRTRSQILINDDLLIDLNADTYMHSLKYGFDMSRLSHVIITHTHADHFYPNEFMNRLEAYANNTVPTLTLHGSREMLEVLIRGTTEDVVYKGQSRVAFEILHPFETSLIGRYRITPLPARHGTVSPYVYLISDSDSSFLMLNDTGRPLPEVYDWLASHRVRLSCVSFDCTYGYENVYKRLNEPGHHMGLIDNVAVRHALEEQGNIDAATVCIATHFSHNGKDVSYDKMRSHTDRYGFMLAYDGMTVEF